MMKDLFFPVLAAVLWACLLVASATTQYHNPVYLVGGYQSYSTYTYYVRGVNLLDATTSTLTLTQLALPSITSSGFCMDANNKDIVVATMGSTYYKSVLSGVLDTFSSAAQLVSR